MLQQQLLRLIYTMYYNNTTRTGVHMLTHDYTVWCSGTWYPQNDQPPLYQQYFIEYFVYLF